MWRQPAKRSVTLRRCRRAPASTAGWTTIRSAAMRRNPTIHYRSDRELLQFLVCPAGASCGMVTRPGDGVNWPREAYRRLRSPGRPARTGRRLRAGAAGEGRGDDPSLWAKPEGPRFEVGCGPPSAGTPARCGPPTGSGSPGADGRCSPKILGGNSIYPGSAARPGFPVRGVVALSGPWPPGTW